MAYIQYCTIPVYPHQFRLTHDISLESLNTVGDGEDYEVGITSPDVHECNHRNKIRSASLKSEPSDCGKWFTDQLMKHQAQRATLNNADINTHSSEGKEDKNDDKDIIIFSRKDRKISESDEVFVKENIAPTLNKEHSEESESEQKPVRSRGSWRKGRRPRKLPEIPIKVTAAPKPNTPTPPAEMTRSLLEELQEADPSLRVYQNIPLSPENNLEVEDHSPEGDSGISHSMDSSIETCMSSECNEILSDECDEVVDKFEFCSNEEYIDDEMKYHGKLQKGPLNMTPTVSLETLKRDASDDEALSDEKALSLTSERPDDESFTCIARSSTSSSFSYDLDDLEATHRGCHKFMPRHSDELFIEIGDPLYVEVEADDLWCEGVNLRTGCHGIFPSAHATDLKLLEEDENGLRLTKFKLQFLGSVEVNYHKGTDVLCQAIHKVAVTRRMTLNATPAPMCTIEINEYGIKMTEKVKKREKDQEPEQKSTFKSRLLKMLSKEKENEKHGVNHFFSLKNISFCGFHPRNDKYFAFITKHPLEMRFACHVFLGMKSTRRVAEAVGTAFQRFYKQYMAFVHQTEDIYIE